MKVPLPPIDATPSKRLYHSIIADYDVNKAISELIDNAVDIWVLGGRTKHLDIKIQLDQNQQRIHFSDNAGGVPKSDLAFIIAPGHTGNPETSETIGMFGVGAKRAVVALAMEVRITTRAKSADTHLIEFNDDWIRPDSWDLPAYKVDSISPGSTEIELTRLRKIINDETEPQLRYHLGTTYSRFLKNRKLKVLLNRVPVKPLSFENWAYPPGYEPRD
jgi:DNA gyrase/topoisomerase IV subunit B